MAALAAGLALVAPFGALAGSGDARSQEETVVRLPIPQDDGSLTPYTFETAYPLVMLVYDSLMWRDPAGEPQPWLAESVDVAGRRVTIIVRDGARWHDGRKVTAADVAFTFRYMTRRFHPRFTPQLDAVRSVRVAGRRRVVVRLARPVAGFVDQPLSDMPVLPRHLWSDVPLHRLAPPGLPVGSGPYRLESRRRGRAYTFEANRRYWGSDVLVDRIEVTVISDFEATLQALERRTVDMLPVSLPEDALGRVEGFGVQIEDGPLFLGTTLLLNVTRPPFDDPEIRRAVAAAIDLTAVARGIGGAVAASTGFVHPGSRWAPDDDVHGFDRSAAAEVLGDSDLPEVRVLVQDNDPIRLGAGREVVNALRGAGIRARLRELPYGRLARAVGQDRNRRRYQAAIWSIPSLVSHDPKFLRAMFGSDEAAAPLNLTGYSSSAFDRLARRAGAARDPERRRSAVAALLDRLAEDAPAVPLLWPVGSFAYRPAIFDGWVFVRGDGILDKQSFLAGERPSVEPRPTPPAPEEPGEGLDLGGFGLVAIGLVGAAGLVALLGLRRR